MRIVLVNRLVEQQHVVIGLVVVSSTARVLAQQERIGGRGVGRIRTNNELQLDHVGTHDTPRLDRNEYRHRSLHDTNEYESEHV